MKRFNGLIITRSGQLIAAATVVFNSLFSNLVYAASLKGFNPSLKAEDLSSRLLCPIFTVMFNVLIAVSVIMVMWGAYTYLTAGDNSEKVSKAHKTLTYAAVAVIVALIAKGFPILIASIFPDANLSSSMSYFSC